MDCISTLNEIIESIKEEEKERRSKRDNAFLNFCDQNGFDDIQEVITFQRLKGGRTLIDSLFSKLMFSERSDFYICAVNYELRENDIDLSDEDLALMINYLKNTKY